LQLQASDYLLKPVSDESLAQSISKVTKKLTLEWEEAASNQRTAQLLKEHQPALKAEYLANLLEGGRLDSEECLPLIDIPYRVGDSVVPVLIRLEGRFSLYNRRDRLLM